MTKHVDFDKIGKKTPFRIPEGFFDEMQQQVLQQVEEKPRRIMSLKHLSYSLIGIAAAVCAFIFIPRNDTDTEIDSESISWVEQISDEDLKAMYDIYEHDIFMDKTN